MGVDTQEVDLIFPGKYIKKYNMYMLLMKNPELKKLRDNNIVEILQLIIWPSVVAELEP